MPSSLDPVFLVDPYSDPIIFKITGRATYLNCGPVGSVLKQLIKKGKRRFALNFQECTGMDSTFLGILAGAAIDVVHTSPKGSIALYALSDRNLELVRNLGLHRILEVESGDFPMCFSEASEAQYEASLESAADATCILTAHEHLMEVDSANRDKFQDVVMFMKNQLDSNGKS